MTVSSPEPTTPSDFWRNLGRFLRGSLRLLLFALVVALVTGAIFLAIPYGYRALILPVQNNRVVVDHVQRSQTQLQKDFIEQSSAQQQQLAQLEADLAAERETRSELESQVAAQAETVTAQADLIENLTQRTQNLAALNETLDTLTENVAGLEQRLSAPDSELSQLQQQTLLLQLSQSVLIARLHLVENNAGQAQTVLAEARPTLDQLAEVAGERGEAVSELQTQLERAEAAIEARPFIALQEVDILAQLLQAFPLQ